MSRFDDDLREATAPLADEPLPSDILDEALDGPPPKRWPALAAAAAVVAVVALAVGVGVGELTLAPSPVPSASPSPGPTDAPVGTCEEIAPYTEEMVRVYFPCGPMLLELANGLRGVGPDTPVVERLETALHAVLDGPQEVEQEAGMVGVVPVRSSVLLGAIELSESDGLAQVDFDPALAEINNLSTSAAGGAFLRSLRETALQFPEVTAVVFQLGGSCDAFFAFFQSTCQHFAEPVAEVNDCPVIPPAELPSGAPITEPRQNPGQPMISWGSGEDTVTQAPGHRDSVSFDEGTPVTVRGYPGFIRPTGDLPLPQPMEIDWVEEGCPYQVFVALSGGEEAVVDYASRFGPVMAQPSPPPGEPVTASVEADGIRLTVVLDRDRTVFGQRVMATTTIENIGSDGVFWGHSGTCLFPASVEARPDRPVPLEYGREDWPSDEGILKMLTLFPLEADAGPVFSFLPEEWLDSDLNHGCTTDLVISEVLPGESLVQRRGWDTLGHFGMPPAPGSYTVVGEFDYMARGERPSFDEEVDEFSVEVPLAITVEGPEIDYVSPGEALDAILSDEGFQSLLADAPRGLWNGQELQYLDGAWEFALYLTESETEVEPVEAIVARVDVRSGVVLDVTREPRTRPPGS
jgi:hypothetical protein